MVHEITGDALDFHSGILCHQTNFFGVMGAGIAATIRDKLLTSAQYREYVNLCREYGSDLLGNVQYLRCEDGTVVANCFSQDDARLDYPKGRIAPLTDYNAMLSCFMNVLQTALNIEKDVYMPYKIGCGIAGGDWRKVRSIINEVFAGSPVNVYIVRRPGDN